MKNLIAWSHRKLLGFSLLELMVVVAILGVLATVAVPRFNIFRARARQSEAKSNLGVIYTLQEAFKIDKENFYDGDHNKWGGTQMNDNGSRDGYTGGGTGACAAAVANNALGFRFANCTEARYGYYMAGGVENWFTAIAFAPSDTTGEKRIFPGCDGTSPNDDKNPGDSPTSVETRCNARYSATYGEGDAWCMDESRQLENYRDITLFCDN